MTIAVWNNFRENVIGRLHHIVKLDIGNNDIQHQNFNHPELIPLLTKLEELSSNDLSKLMLLDVLKHCTSLKRLAIHEATDIISILRAVSCHPTLTSLAFLNCQVSFGGEFLSRTLLHLELQIIDVRDHALYRVAESCPLLTSLVIEYCSLLSDLGIIKIVECCRHLEVLRTVQYEGISNRSLKAIATHCCASLRELHISLYGGGQLIYYPTLKKLLMRAKKLKQLNAHFEEQDDDIRENSSAWQDEFSPSYPDIDIRLGVFS